jgi:hypothetical protein
MPVDADEAKLRWEDDIPVSARFADAYHARDGSRRLDSASSTALASRPSARCFSASGGYQTEVL